MAWKIDDKGSMVVQDGNPVWIGDDGSEVAFDAKASIVSAASAKREAAESRTKLKEAEKKLESFTGIEDPDAAKKALQFAQSMDGKKVMDDDSIKKLIENSVKPWQDKYAEQEKAADAYKNALYTEKVSKQFAASRFINEKTFMTPDAAEAMFGRYFKMEENGKVVAHDASGNPIYSTTKTGETADFEEAISTIFGGYQYKDRYLKGSGQSGSGSQQSNTGGNNSGAKTISRAEFEKLTPAQQSEIAIARKTEIID
ncbi:MAG: DUF6651 domain-containing protein [Desulfuromonadales bacterium]